jgi:hypothetical protein
MTFIVAWKRKGIAYLCADSALTTFADEPIELLDFSSFGERTINQPGHQVAERSIKIFNLQRAMVAICGEYSIAVQVVLALRDELIHVQDIRDAFTRAIKDTLTDIHSRGKIRLIVASPSGTGANVLFYNGDGELTVRELVNDQIVRFGSLDNEPRNLIAEVISQAAAASNNPSRLLASVLGTLQSLGVNSNLLDQGVGGAFYGAYVTAREICWQGDVLYVVKQPGEYWTLPISTSIRDNVLVIKSGITQAKKVLSNALSSECGIEQWSIKWTTFVNEGMEASTYDYVIFLTAGIRNCTIVEMLKSKASRLLQFYILNHDEFTNKSHIEFLVSSELQKAIDEPEINPTTGHTRTRISFFEYEPLTLSG